MSDPSSTTLAIFGLGITVLQQWSSVRQAIYTYRHYERAVQRICQQISIRQTRFRMSLIQLITPYAGYKEAFRMLQDGTHEIWSTQDFQTYLLQVSTGSTDGFLSVIRLIQFDLDDIGMLGKKCGAIIVRAKEDEDKWQAPPSRVSLKEHIKHMLSGGGPREMMMSLKNHTDDFCELINSIQPVHHGTAVVSATSMTKAQIRRNEMIKTASCALYQALSLSCTKDLSHKVRLNLAAQYQDESSIKFTLILQHPDSQPFQPFNRIDRHQKQCNFKLVIESSLKAEESGVPRVLPGVANLVATTQSHQKGSRDPRPLPSYLLRVLKKKQKQITSANATSESALKQGEAVWGPLQLPNFCINQNLCSDLQRIALGMNRRGGPVGYMIYPQDPTERKHTVSIANTDSTAFNELSKLFQSGSSSHSAVSGPNTSSPPNFSKQQRITMAKLLSRALLQYHETPWLEEGWDSNHILVTNNSRLDLQNTFEQESYLDVSLKNPQVYSAPSPKSDGSRLINNESLFRLGVMMLEVACQCPLKTSITIKDKDPHYPANTEYNAAMRMWRSVSCKVGPEFAEVIRKCLQCDFDHGSNLNESGLQEAVYENVVQKLEDLEKALSELTT